ncbi:Short-chain dehydrogenase TIC 32, chloroplastic [Toxocara canis]|nr:Short-chain dehydrogenase TIC 32, chloroplastic [Toxocara canis]
MALPSFQKTIDGYEMTFQCNYLGHFLLSELLMDSLRASGHGRIVNVSSLMHHSADSVAEDVVNNPYRYSRFQTYNRSKLANVMHVRALTAQWRELGENRITANACHPGAVHTNILQYTVFSRQPFRTLLKPIFAFFFKTDQDGAQTPLFLALSAHVDGVSGEYFSDCAKAEMSRLAKDDQQCKLLYEYSRKAVFQPAN